jgi:hypothetical protein
MPEDHLEVFGDAIAAALGAFDFGCAAGLLFLRASARALRAFSFCF